MNGPVALLGSGEFLPVMTDIDRGLLAGRSAMVCHLPTAAAPEGPRSLDRWKGLGREHVESRLGAVYTCCEVTDRATADDGGLADLIADDVGLVYLSGGDPAFLAETLAGSTVWARIVERWKAGSALAGCSAGAMVMGGVTASPRRPSLTPALGVYERLVVLPHFDRFGRRSLLDQVAAQVDDDHVIVGIDEDTALVGDTDGWRVGGTGGVHVRGVDRVHRAGDTVDLPFAWDGSSG